MKTHLSLQNVADPDILQDVQSALRKHGEPMMIKELAQACGISMTTAGKYVEILQAAGIVSVKPFATAKLVALRSGGKGASGEGP